MKKVLIIIMLLSGFVCASGKIPVLYLSEKSYQTGYCMDGIDCPKPAVNYVPTYVFLGACVLVLIALFFKIKNIFGHGRIKLIKK